MGVVYRATDLSLERPVALKLIAPELAEDERFRERFLREPRLAASLDHPNVVPIYEAGERDGQLYLAMRYVEGSDLKTLLEREGKLDARARAARSSPRSPPRSTPPTGAALVHRDVKPAQHAARRGRARLPDRLRHHQAARRRRRPTPGSWSARSTTSRPSRSAASRSTGAPTCYALACVLYECLAGHAAVPPRDRGGDAVGAHARGAAAAARPTPRSTRCSRRRWPRTSDDRYGDLRRADRRRARGARPGPAARPRSRRAALVRRRPRSCIAPALLLLRPRRRGRHRRADDRRRPTARRRSATASPRSTPTAASPRSPRSGGARRATSPSARAPSGS